MLVSCARVISLQRDTSKHKTSFKYSTNSS
jgi:hypothetical protein